MKERYLEELKVLLSEYHINKDELDDILADYEEMIDDAISKGMKEEAIYKMIGTPEQVVKDLSEELEKGEDYIYFQEGKAKKRQRDNKITALMPFISLIVFLILGFGWSLWHPGWLVFLSIPMVAIIVNAFDKQTMNGLVALSPFVAVIVFLIIGFGWNLWHPGWLIFMIVPLLGIMSGKKTMRLLSFLTAISPFICTIAYILAATYTGLWNPLWLIFMIIPMLGILHESKLWKVIVMELAFMIAIAAYLVSGYVYGEWMLGLFSFLIPAGVSILVSDDSFLVINKKNKDSWILFVLLSVIFFGSGILFGNTWAWLWMIYLILPVYSILKHSPNDTKLVAIMPFIATVLFFSLGYFLGWWAFSWIAFLLIPMVAIIKNK